MTKDEIQLWMMIAFIIALLLSSYKVYMIFTKHTPGLSTEAQHAQLQTIIIDFLKEIDDTDISGEELFTLLTKLDILNDIAYKNFNQNRLHQLLQKLFYTYEVDSLRELIKCIKNDA